MTVERVYSLAQLTLLDQSPPQIVAVADEAGYRQAGIRMLPASPGGPAYRLMDEPAMLRETLARMEQTGVGIFDLEIIRLNEGFATEEFLPFMEVGQRLGARAILVAGDDPDEARLTESFARLCAAAAPYGLSCDLEFMPWTKVPDIGTAMRIVEAVAQPNAHVLVDAIHYGRSHSTLAQVSALPAAWLAYAQICDATTGMDFTLKELIHTARSERLLPGEGQVDIAGLFGNLPGDLPVSVEICSDSRAPVMGPVGWARHCLEVSRQALAGVAGR